MKVKIRAEKNLYREKYNFVFLLLVILLFGLGFSTLYSGSLHYGELFFDNPMHFVSRQLRFFAVGIIAMAFFSFIDFRVLRKFLPWLIIISLILCILPFIPGIGEERHGAVRWIKIKSFMFQPSEIVKFVIIIFLANFFDKHEGKFENPFVSIFPPLFVSSIFIMLVYFENDFSAAFFILLITLLMFFISGLSFIWFLRGAFIILPLLLLMILTAEYRIRRILSFLDPLKDPLGSGFQIKGSLDALTSGGLWGRGLGNGVRKISSIPYVYSDFIFVVWAEEMGFVGVCVYFVLLLLFAGVGYKIALTCKDRFSCYVSFGATSAILLQSLLNCAVVSKLAPATGIALPFFSAGGSSLIVTFASCGLIINASTASLKRGSHE